MNIVFVCKGNVGRSQMAEALFKAMSGDHTVSSVGTAVFKKEGERIGDKESAAEVIMAMQEIGIDISHAVRTQVTEPMVETADHVIVMAQRETIPEYLARSDKMIYWDIEDPSGQTLEFTRSTRDQIKEKIETFLKNL